MDFHGTNGEHLHLSESGRGEHEKASVGRTTELTLVWNTGPRLMLHADGRPIILECDQLLFLTEFHHVVPVEVKSCRMARFNRAFYCILDHDSEVGCKGLLFFGAGEAPVVTIPPAEREKFDVLWRMFNLELASPDELQLEMLQMMLKRLLILCTRLYKAQHHPKGAATDQVEIVRHFQFLVETHFRDKRTVAEYAALLHRSPKTLANAFARLGSASPRRMIQDRIQLEARRLLRFTDKPVQEVGYELGFEDVQAFSRFFRKQEGMAPTDYRAASAVVVPSEQAPP